MSRPGLVAKRGLILALLPVFLLPVVAPLLPSNATVAYALSPGDNTLLIKRLVIAQLDQRGRFGHLVLNITTLNKVLNLTNATRVCNVTAHSSTAFNISVEKIYELNTSTRRMVFAEITVYNQTYSQSFYLLAYRAEHPGFNVTIVTRIITDPETGNYKYFITTANIEPRQEHPVADIVVIPNETTLSQSYKLLAKTLVKISRGDNDTKTIWPKVAMELRHLSVLVQKHLQPYNKKAKTIAIITDGYWDCLKQCASDVCGVPNAILGASCALACGLCYFEVISCSYCAWCSIILGASTIGCLIGCFVGCVWG
ncbi:hypothetical protein [Pyrofollis japonicus]|uniref:hypothetical protein n=1 Tax=Pyrofollis japonicus TaxID=3060460 RepID=UPI00295C0BEC|nr:hypothetical protein [Pyrofollis japonicus]